MNFFQPNSMGFFGLFASLFIDFWLCNSLNTNYSFDGKLGPMSSTCMLQLKKTVAFPLYNNFLNHKSNRQHFVGFVSIWRLWKLLNNYSICVYFIRYTEEIHGSFSPKMDYIIFVDSNSLNGGEINEIKVTKLLFFLVK